MKEDELLKQFVKQLLGYLHIALEWVMPANAKLNIITLGVLWLI